MGLAPSHATRACSRRSLRRAVRGRRHRSDVQRRRDRRDRRQVLEMTAAGQQRLVRMLWSAAAVMALLWPAHTVGPLDGIPFDTRAEALLLGLALPAVWW